MIRYVRSHNSRIITKDKTINYYPLNQKQIYEGNKPQKNILERPRHLYYLQGREAHTRISNSSSNCDKKTREEDEVEATLTPENGPKRCPCLRLQYRPNAPSDIIVDGRLEASLAPWGLENRWDLTGNSSCGCLQHSIVEAMTTNELTWAEKHLEQVKITCQCEMNQC